MFCPNCGEKMEDQTQKFCTSCGSEMPFTSETPQLKKEVVQTSSTIQPQSIPIYKPKSVQIGGPGPDSKKCLIFAMGSIVLFVIGVSIGGFAFMRNIGSFYFFPMFNIGFLGLIVAVVFNILGLVFGILSRIFSGRAASEPINNVERFGSVIAVFGIIFNVIPIVIVPIIIVLGSGFLFSYLMF